MATPIWPPESFDEAVIIAQRVRICQYESAIRQMLFEFQQAEREVRKVLIGAGASHAETLIAALAMARLGKLIRDAQAQPEARPDPSPEQIEAGRLGTPVLVK